MILILISPYALAQNKLQNGSFENGDYDSGETSYKNYMTNLDNWDHNAYIPLQGPETWHSPDWMDESLFADPIVPDGDKLAAMYEYEIIEQNLTSSNKLLANQVYLFSVWVNLWDYGGYEDFSLNFYLANQKLKYTGRLSCDFCDSDYMKIVTSPKKTIKNIELDPYETDQWFNIKFTFVPSIDYDWFGIDMMADVIFPYAPGAECKSHYVLIDNVSITEENSCATCVRTDGPLTASSPLRYQSGNGPLAVHSLDNMEYATDIVN